MRRAVALAKRSLHLENNLFQNLEYLNKKINKNFFADVVVQFKKREDGGQGTRNGTHPLSLSLMRRSRPRPRRQIHRTGWRRATLSRRGWLLLALPDGKPAFIRFLLKGSLSFLFRRCMHILTEKNSIGSWPCLVKGNGKNALFRRFWRIRWKPTSWSCTWQVSWLRNFFFRLTLSFDSGP